MPRMSKKRKQEWALFLNERNRITVGGLCRKCRNDCKPPAALTEPAEQVPEGGLTRAALVRPANPAPAGGGLLSLSPANPAVSLIFCPHPPTPLPGGKGGDFLFSYAKGFAPCIPATEPEAALIVPAEQVPKGRLNLRFSAKTKGDGSLWAKPAAKERGDRGRWNYPSLTRRRRLRWSSPPGQVEQVPQGFSPPQGAANARRTGNAGARPPPGTTAAGQTSAAGGLMPGMQGAKPLA